MSRMYYLFPASKCWLPKYHLHCYWYVIFFGNALRRRDRRRDTVVNATANTSQRCIWNVVNDADNCKRYIEQRAFDWFTIHILSACFSYCVHKNDSTFSVFELVESNSNRTILNQQQARPFLNVNSSKRFMYASHCLAYNVIVSPLKRQAMLYIVTNREEKIEREIKRETNDTPKRVNTLLLSVVQKPETYINKRVSFVRSNTPLKRTTMLIIKKKFVVYCLRLCLPLFIVFRSIQLLWVEQVRAIWNSALPLCR